MEIWYRMTTVRPERDGDVEAIHYINRLAFDTAAEARLVDLLRERGKLLLSLVAEHHGQAVGHIVFTRVIAESRPELRGVGLGPMAVVPSLQRRGIGSLLVQAGLAECLAIASDFAVVLGHPHYYPRFGFAPASRFGLRCSWQVPDDVFMALEFRPGTLAGAAGLVQYQPEFNE